MQGSQHVIRYAVADANGQAVAACIETIVYTYAGENGPAVVAETAAYLEDELRSSGRDWTDLPAGATTPQPGDVWSSADASAPSST